MYTKTNPPNINTISTKFESDMLLYKLINEDGSMALLGQATDLSNLSGVIIKGSKNAMSALSNQFTLTPKASITLFTNNALLRNKLFGSYAPFVKTFIIRGIGYQASIMENSLASKEFPYSRYLSLRVGHSFNLYKPIPNYIGVKISHKDRKLVIYGSNKEQVSNYAKVIFKLRQPSVYTGRGIRVKKGFHRRKLGKKDIRKGKV